MHARHRLSQTALAYRAGTRSRRSAGSRTSACPPPSRCLCGLLPQGARSWSQARGRARFRSLQTSSRSRSGRRWPSASNGRRAGTCSPARWRLRQRAQTTDPGRFRSLSDQPTETRAIVRMQCSALRNVTALRALACVRCATDICRGTSPRRLPGVLWRWSRCRPRGSRSRTRQLDRQHKRPRRLASGPA